jgi:hypothetical protein
MKQTGIKRCQERIDKNKIREAKNHIPAPVKPVKYNYLKYWRLVKYWAQVEMKLLETDVYMLLYIYAERPFTMTYFKQYDSTFTHQHSKFDRFLREGYIVKFRQNYKTYGTLYTLSFKGKRICDDIYKILEGKKHVQVGGHQHYVKKVTNIALRRMKKDTNPPESRLRPPL